MKRLTILPAAMLVMGILWSAPVGGQSETSVTGAGAGIFPPSSSYLGVRLNTLTLGMGLTVGGGLAEGQFQATLTGVSALGLEQEIQVEGKAITGNSAVNTAIFSGVCTVEVGDGTPPLPGVPFTVAVATNGDGTGTLALTLGATNLPGATMNEGSITIR
jgi:hypothetical protein